MKKIFGVFALLALVALCVVACDASSNSGGNTVGLAAASFTPSSITIKKGQSITLVNQTGTVHIIGNGTWQGNTQDPQNETGAPVINNVMFSSTNQSQTVGPFNTSGTFHYYCSVHPGMNLTVIVQ